jgi:hypothetical protein
MNKEELTEVERSLLKSLLNGKSIQEARDLYLREHATPADIVNKAVADLDVFLKSRDMPLAEAIKWHYFAKEMFTSAAEKHAKIQKEVHDAVYSLDNLILARYVNVLTEKVVADIYQDFPNIREQLERNKQRKEREKRQKQIAQLEELERRYFPKAPTLFNVRVSQAEKRLGDQFNEAITLLKSSDLNTFSPADFADVLKKCVVSDFQARSFSQPYRDFHRALREFVETLEKFSKSKPERIDMGENKK